MKTIAFIIGVLLFSAALLLYSWSDDQSVKDILFQFSTVVVFVCLIFGIVILQE